MEASETIANVIGDEYQSWVPYDKVFISSPTGTGKTYFILNVLLPYVCQQKKRILYLVNRRILKEQLEIELSSYTFDERNQIKIELYQTIEMKIFDVRYDKQIGVFQAFGYRALSDLNNYDYIVCDECHYFLADSNYNSNTGLSFRWIQDTFSSKIRIFLSATIHDIKAYIRLDDEKRRYNKTFCYGFHEKNSNVSKLVHGCKDWDYKDSRYYDYLDVQIINREDEIFDLVANGSGKWLIFVDNISFGKKLQTELIAKWKLLNEEGDNNVVMLSSDYENSQDSTQEVNYIKKDNKQSAKVLISTSVMDNGISLKDTSLRNIVLIADTEVEFIQMLGRKRRDDEQVRLYIYKQSKVHFSNRLWKIRKMRDIAEKYWQDAKQKVEQFLVWQLESNDSKINGPDWNCINNIEQVFIYSEHRKIMNDIAWHKIDFNDVLSIFNIYNGILYLNLLSFRQIEILAQYYNKILDSFDSDGEDAFLKEQLRWLGKPDAEIEDIIGKAKVSREEKSRQVVLEKLEEIQDTVMDNIEAIAFKKDVRDDLLVLIQLVDESNNEKETVVESLKKNDRPISKKNMEFIKEFCNIPFEVVVEKASNGSVKDGKKDTTYVVRRVV